jgi:hypothetical protein
LTSWGTVRFSGRILIHWIYIENISWLFAKHVINFNPKGGVSIATVLVAVVSVVDDEDEWMMMTMKMIMMMDNLDNLNQQGDPDLPAAAWLVVRPRTPDRFERGTL